MNPAYNIDKSLAHKALEEIAKRYSDKNKKMVAETFLDAKMIFGLEARLPRVYDFSVEGKREIPKYLRNVKDILKEAEDHIPVISEDGEESIGIFSGKNFEEVYKLLDNDVVITGSKEVIYQHLEDVRHKLNDLGNYIRISAEEYAASVGMPQEQLDQVRERVIDIDKII